jgi:cation:H+ antiporter
MDIAISILGGLAVLVLGAEFLVRGAVRLAERLGVSPLVIGLTVVGFGTSSPELVTSVQGALMGEAGIAVGNIVGSNLFNILVILGISAMITPLAVTQSALRRDGTIVLAVTALFVAVGYLWTLDRVVGALFLLLLAGYLVYAFRQEKVAGGSTAAGERAIATEGLDPATVPGRGGNGWLVPTLFAVGGLALLVLGARWFVGGSIELARTLGISETVIGLTIVAAGTSMPELATSAVAALRRQSDVAVGNILGSNIYNILGIGGVTALISPTVIPAEIVAFDNLVMLAISALLMGFMFTGLRVTRGEGAALFAGYLAYVWWIWPA